MARLSLDLLRASLPHTAQLTAMKCHTPVVLSSEREKFGKLCLKHLNKWWFHMVPKGRCTTHWLDQTRQSLAQTSFWSWTVAGRDVTEFTEYFTFSLKDLKNGNRVYLTHILFMQQLATVCLIMLDSCGNLSRRSLQNPNYFKQGRWKRIVAFHSV